MKQVINETSIFAQEVILKLFLKVIVTESQTLSAMGSILRLSRKIRCKTDNVKNQKATEKVVVNLKLRSKEDLSANRSSAYAYII